MLRGSTSLSELRARRRAKEQGGKTPPLHQHAGEPENGRVLAFMDAISETSVNSEDPAAGRTVRANFRSRLAPRPSRDSEYNSADSEYSDEDPSTESSFKTPSFAVRMREVRRSGEGVRLSSELMGTATRHELEYELQLSAREQQKEIKEMMCLRSENKALRERVVRLTDAATEQQGQAAADITELRELRRLREENNARTLVEQKQGPGDAQWLKLRKAEEAVRLREEQNEASLRRREAALKTSEDDLRLRLEAARERELIAETKAAAALQAIDAANEANTAAEQAASEGSKTRARDALLVSVRAVASDRMRTRNKRRTPGEQLGAARSSAPQRAKPSTNSYSGLAMLLDAVFLGATRTPDGERIDLPPVSEAALPTLLRATAAGREAEAIILHRPPRARPWLHGLIDVICADKLLHDQAAERLGEPSVALAPFLVHWANSRFGMPQTCMLNLWTLHQALVTHRPKSVEAATISLFVEMPDTPRALRIQSFYLHARAHVLPDLLVLGRGTERRYFKHDQKPGANMNPYEPPATPWLGGSSPRGHVASPGGVPSPGFRELGHVAALRPPSPAVRDRTPTIEVRIGGSGVAGAGGAASMGGGNRSPQGVAFRVPSANIGLLPSMSTSMSTGMLPSPSSPPPNLRSGPRDLVVTSEIAGGSARSAAVAARDGSASPTQRGRGRGLLPPPMGDKSDKPRDRPDSSSGVADERRVLPLTKAWEAAQFLLKPAAQHVRLAWLRELQAAAFPQAAGVPPPLRATMPTEFQVVDLEHFLLSACVFFDFSTQLSAQPPPSPQITGDGTAAAGKKGGTLVEFPLAASLLAVLRRSMLLSAVPEGTIPGKMSAEEPADGESAEVPTRGSSSS